MKLTRTSYLHPRLPDSNPTTPTASATARSSQCAPNRVGDERRGAAKSVFAAEQREFALRRSQSAAGLRESALHAEIDEHDARVRAADPQHLDSARIDCGGDAAVRRAQHREACLDRAKRRGRV